MTWKRLAASVAFAIAGRSLTSRVTRALLVTAAAPAVVALLAPPRLAAVLAPAAALVCALLMVALLSRSLRRAFALLQAAVDEPRSAPSGEPEAPAVAEVRALASSIRSLAEAFRKSSDQLVYQAFHDPLTGLPNRAHFLAALRDALRNAGSRDRVAVLFFDLDRFKVINDSLGHVAGDRLLVVLAQRVSRLVRPNRLLARLAGDEFVLLIVGPSAEAEAVECAERIVRLSRRPFAIDGRELYATCSIGITVRDPRRTTPASLLREADIALYQAKERGRAQFALFDEGLAEGGLERVELDAALRRAVAREQLQLRFQPIFDLRTGAPTGAEALLRWHHPHRGVLPPSAFLDLAEETGEILRIGQWVLGAAARQAAAIARKLPPGSRFSISVNLSAREFDQPDLERQVRRALRRYGLDGSALCLEVTETVLMRDVAAAARALHHLKRLGIRVAIDDFGTGYSSLGYLQQLPADVLKIDRGFVTGLSESGRSTAIVESVVRLGRALGMETVAEGIEDAAVLELLRQLGCSYGQGHYLSPPLDEHQLRRFLDRTLGLPLAM